MVTGALGLEARGQKRSEHAHGPRHRTHAITSVEDLFPSGVCRCRTASRAGTDHDVCLRRALRCPSLPEKTQATLLLTQSKLEYPATSHVGNKKLSKNIHLSSPGASDYLPN